MVKLLADVDVLALEFNHDVGLQQASGRPPHLIARVLGNEGHLSNEQAGSLLSEVLKSTRPNRLQSVVQLHLSRQCNRVRLARVAAQKALHDHCSSVAIHTAHHETPVCVDV
jgi:phosphoribosyl 1,2-cyclic phosphodiesterase